MIKPVSGEIKSAGNLGHRIAIIGCCGAGKSTLARQLSRILGHPAVHLDAHYWRADWVECPDAEWRQTVAQLSQEPAWIMDGNYSGTFDIRFPLADTIIFLDFQRWRCLLQVLQRIWRYHGRVRPDMSAGCPERFDWEFLRYVWNFPQHNRPKILQALARYAEDKQVITLRNPSDTRRFLNPFQQASDRSLPLGVSP